MRTDDIVVRVDYDVKRRISSPIAVTVLVNGEKRHYPIPKGKCRYNGNSTIRFDCESSKHSFRLIHDHISGKWIYIDDCDLSDDKTTVLQNIKSAKNVQLTCLAKFAVDIDDIPENIISKKGLETYIIQKAKECEPKSIELVPETYSVGDIRRDNKMRFKISTETGKVKSVKASDIRFIPNPEMKFKYYDKPSVIEAKTLCISPDYCRILYIMDVGETDYGGKIYAEIAGIWDANKKENGDAAAYCNGEKYAYSTSGVTKTYWNLPLSILRKLEDYVEKLIIKSNKKGIKKDEN